VCVRDFVCRGPCILGLCVLGQIVPVLSVKNCEVSTKKCELEPSPVLSGQHSFSYTQFGRRSGCYSGKLCNARGPHGVRYCIASRRKVENFEYAAYRSLILRKAPVRCSVQRIPTILFLGSLCRGKYLIYESVGPYSALLPLYTLLPPILRFIDAVDCELAQLPQSLNPFLKE
jgi:hypothetical protein